MQVIPVGVCKNNISGANFKASYPVVHWVRVSERKECYPVVTEEFGRKFQNILLRLMNKTGSKKDDRVALMDRVNAYVSRNDRDFKELPVARSYYDKNRAKNKPYAYLITGKDAKIFDENFGKPIGRAKSASPKIDGIYKSAEVLISIGDYIMRGFNYIKSKAPFFKNKNGEQLCLHTIFEPIRSRNGRIKDYKLVDMKYLPINGNENPLIRGGYIK